MAVLDDELNFKIGLDTQFIGKDAKRVESVLDAMLDGMNVRLKAQQALLKQNIGLMKTFADSLPKNWAQMSSKLSALQANSASPASGQSRAVSSVNFEQQFKQLMADQDKFKANLTERLSNLAVAINGLKGKSQGPTGRAEENVDLTTAIKQHGGNVSSAVNLIQALFEKGVKDIVAQTYYTSLADLITQARNRPDDLAPSQSDFLNLLKTIDPTLDPRENKKASVDALATNITKALHKVVGRDDDKAKIVGKGLFVPKETISAIAANPITDEDLKKQEPKTKAYMKSLSNSQQLVDQEADTKARENLGNDKFIADIPPSYFTFVHELNTLLAHASEAVIVAKALAEISTSIEGLAGGVSKGAKLAKTALNVGKGAAAKVVEESAITEGAEIIGGVGLVELVGSVLTIATGGPALAVVAGAVGGYLIGHYLNNHFGPLKEAKEIRGKSDELEKLIHTNVRYDPFKNAFEIASPHNNHVTIKDKDLVNMTAAQIVEQYHLNTEDSSNRGDYNDSPSYIPQYATGSLSFPTTPARQTPSSRGTLKKSESLNATSPVLKKDTNKPQPNPNSTVPFAAAIAKGNTTNSNPPVSKGNVPSKTNPMPVVQRAPDPNDLAQRKQQILQQQHTASSSILNDGRAFNVTLNIYTVRDNPQAIAAATTKAFKSVCTAGVSGCG